MVAINTIDCTACLEEGTAELRLDEENRIFMFCFACLTYTVIEKPAGLKGISFLCPAIRPLLVKIGIKEQL